MKFIDIVWAAFFARVKPVSTIAKPACMNITRKPARSVHTKLMAILLWPTVSITSDSVGILGILHRHVRRRAGRRAGRVARRLPDGALRVHGIRRGRHVAEPQRQQRRGEHLHEESSRVSSSPVLSCAFTDRVRATRTAGTVPGDTGSDVTEDAGPHRHQ